jgi:tRNA pseudouridine32 synthase/23S rRNA pseudouridine746 synthase
VRRSLLAQVRSILSNPELTPAHRIDRDTSGLVLFVQRAEDRSTFQGLFARRAVHKVYEAICRGESEPPAFTTVRSRIERTDDRFRWRSVPDPVGPSRSDVYLVGADAAAGAASWPARGTVGRAGGRADAQSQFTPGSRPEPTRWRFRIVPESGRPHQVRLHLDQLGFPLVGDPLYPQRRQVPVTEGPLRLLAAELRFRDPRTRVWRFFRTEQSLTDLATAPEA